MKNNSFWSSKTVTKEKSIICRKFKVSLMLQKVRCNQSLQFSRMLSCQKEGSKSAPKYDQKLATLKWQQKYVKKTVKTVTLWPSYADRIKNFHNPKIRILHLFLMISNILFNSNVHMMERKCLKNTVLPRLVRRRTIRLLSFSGAH